MALVYGSGVRCLDADYSGAVMRWRVVFYGLTMFAIGAFIGILYGQQVYVLEVEAHVTEWPCEIDEADGI